MKKLNSRGFGAVEILLILLIVGILGGVGWYVWHSRNNANTSYNNSSNASSVTKPAVAIKTFDECKKATGSKIQETFPEVCVTEGGKKFTDTSDETAKWYTFSNKDFSIRVPDGWKLTSISNAQDLFAFDAANIKFASGSKASVDVENVGGRDYASIAFMLMKIDSSLAKSYTRGTKQSSFLTNEGASVDKYYFVQTDKQATMDIPYGAHEYLYFIKKDNTYLYLKHDVLSGETDQTKYIELALKTLVIK